MSVNIVNNDGSLTRVAGGTLFADAPVGSIQAYGGATAPSGWLLCQGQAVSRTEYADLFKAIGTAFGEGDGSTTFNIPDLRESVPKGTGLTSNSDYHLNNNGGLSVGEFIDDRLQGHRHSIQNGFDGASEGSAERGDGRHGYSIHSTLPEQYSADYGTPRIGSTTEVKAVGVNYIIKAKMVAVPFDVAEYIRKWDELEPIPSVRIGSYSGWTSGDLTQNYTMEHDGIVNVFLDENTQYYVITDLNGSTTQIGAPTVHGGASSSMSLFLKKGYKIRLSTNTYSGLSIQYYLNRD